VPVGGFYPVTQWELRFSEFRQLIESAGSRGQVSELLRSWFRYSLVSCDSGSEIVDPRGDRVDSLTVHLKIQEDPGKQFALYQFAMSIWR
jgi:hypothetical protein